jgi:hypothetical protein
MVRSRRGTEVAVGCFTSVPHPKIAAAPTLIVSIETGRIGPPIATKLDYTPTLCTEVFSSTSCRTRHDLKLISGLSFGHSTRTEALLDQDNSTIASGQNHG